MKLLVLDNYDSFTYNLVHILRELGVAPDVFRNDRITLEDVKGYDKILLSPGPGIPSEAGIMMDVIRACGPSKDILGVCLGHQGIAEVYGASLVNLGQVLHGVTSTVSRREPDPLFEGLPSSFRVCHYHSWSVDPESVTGKLRVTSVNEHGLVMSLRHVDYKVSGVQFHPESIMTEHGRSLIRNWVNV